MINYYILDEDNNVVIVDMFECFKWEADNSERRIIGKDTMHDIEINTVFSNISIGWDENGRPLMFETLVSGDNMEPHVRRYRSYKEAVEGHTTVITLVLQEIGTTMNVDGKGRTNQG